MEVEVRATPPISSLIWSIISLLLIIGVVVFFIYFFRRMFHAMNDIKKIRENTDEIIKYISNDE
ncbi:hypothetical protein KQI42_15075 [Tissierella sp. MSJ-40]|uniref:DUF4083 domain-containing protein n=1 Tax=Tissierella simiarum TaxID=2841534 RepID=A0ABS6EAA7_9FIRM|nr:hypothetical protein [Tissierella simiarum]MBU5439345.1 hypothetical protein [Tissierella simiarum]